MATKSKKPNRYAGKLNAPHLDEPVAETSPATPERPVPDVLARPATPGK